MFYLGIFISRSKTVFRNIHTGRLPHRGSHSLRGFYLLSSYKTICDKHLHGDMRFWCLVVKLNILFTKGSQMKRLFYCVFSHFLFLYSTYAICRVNRSLKNKNEQIESINFSIQLQPNMDSASHAVHAGKYSVSARLAPLISTLLCFHSFCFQANPIPYDTERYLVTSQTKLCSGWVYYCVKTQEEYQTRVVNTHLTERRHSGNE